MAVVKRRDVLATVLDAEEVYGSLVSSSYCTRRDIMRCVAAGLVESAGQVVLCDGDGAHLEPERWREGFKLTKAGRAVVRPI